ncbi:hypothetical protein H5410_004752 [Solanum commersonii]|uniref:Uncharacterized protein n=1 Tax=Solanum commersonii TaxID=4109 RepID=A0A9J6A4H2_SOLCO|nr:hypothetical protein H5410_004752 [Solanum commersonii]
MYLINGLYYPIESYKTRSYYEEILIKKFLKPYKEWTKVSPDLNKLYHVDHICWLEKIDQIYFFIEFSIPWIYKWTPEVGFKEENIPCLYMTYYNNFWDKLVKQNPKTKQLIGQELLDIISKRIKEYNKIPQRMIVDDNSMRHIARMISFQDGDNESMINDYLEEVRRNLRQINKLDTSMQSETSNNDIVEESQQAKTDNILFTTEIQDAEEYLQQMKAMDKKHGKEKT